MFVDKNLQLSGNDGVAQTLATATSDYSDDWVDLGVLTRISEGEPLTLRCIPTVTFAGANAADTVSLELRAFPVLQSAVATASVVLDTSENLFTPPVAGHGLPNGTRVIMSSLATSTGITDTTVSYYIVNSTADTYQVALTPGGAVVELSGSDGTVTVTVQPEVLTSSGPVGLQRFLAGTVVAVQTGVTIGSIQPGMYRYVYAYLECSQAFSAGACYLQLAFDNGIGSEPFIHHASGFTVE